MVKETAFLVVPTGDPTSDEDLEGLDRSARIARLEDRWADLDMKIRARLHGFELEFLAGVGTWTVRTTRRGARGEVVAKLAGLPVEVAPDERFHAL